MQSIGYVIITMTLIAFLCIGVFAFAYLIGDTSKVYQFSSATQLQDGPGTVVFHLTDGKSISFQNEWTMENVQPSEMVQGGFIRVWYSFTGYPVSVDYIGD